MAVPHYIILREIHGSLSMSAAFRWVSGTSSQYVGDDPEVVGQLAPFVNVADHTQKLGRHVGAYRNVGVDPFSWTPDSSRNCVRVKESR